MRLKIGNIYSITYNDHFRAEKSSTQNPELLKPVVLRAIGKLVAITPLQFNLQSQLRSDCPYPESVADVYGIMRSCIIDAADLGPDPHLKG